MQEELFPLKGYVGLYLISKNGDIFSLRKNRYLSYGFTKGYKSISLNKNKKNKTYLVHRLVIKNFKRNMLNKTQVNHKDCDKLNNNIENLEWCTPRENVLHAVNNGVNGNRKGEKNGRNKLLEVDIIKIRGLLDAKMFQKDIASIFNVSQSCIMRINTKRNWSWLA